MKLSQRIENMQWLGVSLCRELSNQAAELEEAKEAALTACANLRDELTAARLERDEARNTSDKALRLGDDMARALNGIAKDAGYKENSRARDWYQFAIAQLTNKEPTTTQLAEVMGLPATIPPTSVASTEAPTQDPWAAYPPPAGEQWHNPDGLTPDHVGVKDGWRLLLRSEINPDKSNHDGCLQAYQHFTHGWGGSRNESDLNDRFWPKRTVPKFTYRTRAPLPAKSMSEKLRDALEATREKPKPFKLPWNTIKDEYCMTANKQCADNDRALAAEVNSLRERLAKVEEAR